MKNSERFKLHGTYKTPLVRRGTVLTCEDRDCDVVVTRLSNGRIPWPLGRKRGYKHGQGGFILFGALAEAVRRESNQAVAYWFGVTISVVSRWRRALGIRYRNEGSHKLRESLKGEKWFKRFWRNGVAASLKPEVRKRIAKAQKGRTLNPRQLVAIRRPKSAETRAKLSAARIAAAKVKATHGQLFTPEVDEIIRTHSAGEAIRLTGRTPESIYSRRKVLGIAATPKRSPANFTAKDDKIIRTQSPGEAARLTGRTMSSIYARRFQLGVTERRK